MNVGESLSVQITSDASNASTTLQSAGLPFNVGANESYHFQYILTCTSTNLAGFEHKLNAPGCSGTYVNVSSTSASMGSNLSVNTQYGKQGTFQDTHANIISGDLVNSGGATTCDLEFAQNTSNVTATKIKAGSSVVYTRTA